MGLLDRISECNRFDAEAFHSFRVGEEQVGWVPRWFAPRLEGWPGIFASRDDAVVLDSRLATYADRTAAMAAALRSLYEDDPTGFGRWTGEAAPVLSDWHRPPPFEVERAAVPVLLGRGAHLNGLVLGDGLKVWVARRHRTLASDPGKLDQLTAGFLPAGASPRENLLAEAAEGAGVPAALLAGMRAVGAVTVSYRRQTEMGLVRGAVYVFDLELPAEFEPVNHDGEVEAFHLLGAGERLAILAESRAFKFDCALVAIDLLMWHGVIPPTHPDYLTLVKGLHG